MRNRSFCNSGFTLIELLVVTAVIGVLGVISANLISTILRSQNKTAIINEVRQNGNLVIDKIDRDVRQSEVICPIDPSTSLPDCALPTGTSVSLTTTDGSTIVWDCDDFKRDNVSVINTDPNNGVKVDSCNFSVTPRVGTKPQIVTLIFTLSQRNTVSRSEFQAKVDFEVTVGTRAYY